MRGIYHPHRCATVSNTGRNRPSQRDIQAHQKLQEKVSDFQVQFHAPIYLSIGIEAKRGYMSCDDTAASPLINR